MNIRPLRPGRRRNFLPNAGHTCYLKTKLLNCELLKAKTIVKLYLHSLKSCKVVPGTTPMKILTLSVSVLVIAALLDGKFEDTDRIAEESHGIGECGSRLYLRFLCFTCNLATNVHGASDC